MNKATPWLLGLLFRPLGGTERIRRRGSGRCRAGVTLVELMMTITIIGLIAGLLLPAIGLARESARRTACANNLSQLALGAVSHDSSLSRLPGWRNSVSGYSTTTGNAVSWTVPLLPFIGEKELSSWYQDYTGVGQDDVTVKRVGLFVCPSADSAARAAISYAGNGGTGAEVLDSTSQYSGDGALLDTVGNGATYTASQSNLDEIRDGDGVAKTLLFIERCGAAAPATLWTVTPLATAAGTHQFATTHAVLLPPALGGNPPTDKRIINPSAATIPFAGDTLWAYRYPSSPHKGGVTAAFCDGHVKFLSDRVDPWVYCSAMTSISGSRSTRATGWERYQLLNDSWVTYILDEADLAK